MTLSKSQLDKVYARDGGVCSHCGVSTDQLKALLELKEKKMVELNEANKFDSHKEFNKRLKDLGYKPGRSLWEAHHVKAQAHDGPDDLDNIITLCCPCHTKETGLQSGGDAKAARAMNKAKRTPPAIKAAKRKNKSPNIRLPGSPGGQPVWSLGNE